MIEVTGATDGSQPAEAGANRYDLLDGEKRSRLPLIIALIITGVAGYLRTAFPDLRWPGQAAEPPAADDVERVAPVLEIVAAPAADEQAPDAPQYGIFAARLLPAGDIYGRYGSNVVAFPSARHTLIDSPPFRFDPPPIHQPIALAVPPTPAKASGPPSGEAPALGGNGDGQPAPDRRNRAPDGPGTIRLNEAVAGGVLLIGLDQLLAGMKDIDGDQLEVGRIVASEGAIARTTEGFVYSSNAAALPSTVMVTFEVSDGYNTIVRTALIPLVRGVIAGTAADDAMTGTARADQIDAGDGADMVDARAGNDYVVGGEGDDQIVAGAGDDVVIAGAGDDVVFGGNGDDVVSGGTGNDRLHGDAGDDMLAGDEGHDHLLGGLGDDLLLGGDGDDLLEDGGGSDRVLGGDGGDTVRVAKDGARDHFEGGTGEDTLDYSDHTMGVVINTADGSAASADAGGDTFVGFEVLVGGSGNDIFTVGGEEMRLTGGDGQDTFIFELPQAIDRPTLIHDILDFVTGDRIRVASFEFTMDERDDEDRFDRYYRDRDDDAENGALELRIRHRHDEDGSITIFEFDGDGDFEFEMTVAVHGHHQPFVYETATA